MTDQPVTNTHHDACADPGHKEHLCYLLYDGYNFHHKAEYRALVRDAAYICQNCGRTAARPENLCMPQPL